MPLPTLEKTWAFSVNNATAAGASIAESLKRAGFGVISAIVALGWTVRGSSNGTVGAMDGVNRFATYLDWNTSTSDSGARSWVVFRHPSGTFDILIEGRAATTTNSDRYWRVYVSPGGLFAGGSANARPTASDELLLTSANGDTFAHTTQAAHVVHAMGSTDGTQLRVIVLANGATTGVLNVGVAGDAMDGVTGGVIGAVTFSGTWSLLGSGTNFKALVNGASAACYMGSLGWATTLAPSSTVAQVPQLDGNWVILPAAYVCITVGTQGVLGRPVDVWYGPSTRPMGSTYPEDGSAQLVQFDQLVLPWNGTVPVVA